MLRAPDQTGEQSDVIRPSSYSNAKILFQSLFMLTIIQSCFFAMSYIAWLKVPTLVSGVESDGSCREFQVVPSDTRCRKLQHFPIRLRHSLRRHVRA